MNSGSKLSREQVADLFARRKSMLASIAEFITPTLLKTLEKKVEYECVSLTSMIQADERSAEAQRTSRAALDPQYFIKRPLDIQII